MEDSLEGSRRLGLDLFILVGWSNCSLYNDSKYIQVHFHLCEQPKTFPVGGDCAQAFTQGPRLIGSAIFSEWLSVMSWKSTPSRGKGKEAHGSFPGLDLGAHFSLSVKRNHMTTWNCKRDWARSPEAEEMNLVRTGHVRRICI